MEPEGSLPHSQVPRHLSLSWARSIRSIPTHPTSWRSILIFSSHLHLVLPSGSFPQVSPPKPVHEAFTKASLITKQWSYNVVYRDVSQSNLVEIYQRFCGAYCFLYPEDAGSKFLQNNGKSIPGCIMPYPPPPKKKSSWKILSVLIRYGEV